MKIIPAIDLRGGRLVRLQQGDYDRETRYDTDPVELARRYEDAGAKSLHVVDLDAARSGGAPNLETIRAIAGALSIPVQTGGGVRERADLDMRLEAGCARVVIGSLCVREPATVAGWLESAGADRIVAGIDVKKGIDGAWFPQAAGWTQEGSQDAFALIEQLENAGLKHLLCTDIERDGMYAGPALGLYRDLCESFPQLVIQASGGVGQETELDPLAHTGVAGCIIGRALIEGRVPLSALGKNYGSTYSGAREGA